MGRAGQRTERTEEPARRTPPPMPDPVCSFVVVPARDQVWTIYAPAEGGGVFAERVATCAPPGEYRAPEWAATIGELTERLEGGHVDLHREKPRAAADKAEHLRAILGSRRWRHVADAELHRTFGYHRRTLARWRRRVEAERFADEPGYVAATARIVRRPDGREVRLSMWYQRERRARSR
jgi:hypothetical protein